MIRAVDASVLPVTQVPAVLDEWRTPPVARGFAADGKTAWRLFNAFTETWKGRNLAALPRRSQALARPVGRGVRPGRLTSLAVRRIPRSRSIVSITRDTSSHWAGSLPTFTSIQ